MRIEYEVCDRCGERLVERKGLFMRLNPPKVLQYRRVVCGDASDYELVLCDKCTKAFDDWRRATDA